MQPEQLGAGVLGTHRRGDAVAFAAQEARQQIANAAVVIDQQEMRGVVGRLRRRSCERCSLGHHYSFAFAVAVPVPKMASSTLSGASRSLLARRNWRIVSTPGGGIS